MQQKNKVFFGMSFANIISKLKRALLFEAFACLAERY